MRVYLHSPAFQRRLWLAASLGTIAVAGLAQGADLGDDFSPDSGSPYTINSADTAGDVWIGISASGVSLNIIGGGGLTLYPEPITNNATSFFVGIDSGNNTASVAGTSNISQASLSVLDAIFVGLNDSSDSNSMTMGAWSTVSANRLILGTNDNSQLNLVTASEATGSLALTSDMIIGLSGDSNSVTVDTGRLVTVGGHVYIGTNPGSTGNSLNVTGTGSTLTSAQEMLLGFGGDSNSLNVLSGGLVTNRHTYIGFSNGADNNAVTVSGTNSLWRTNGVFYFSFASDNNQVTVNSGGQVIVGSGTGIVDTFVVDSDGALRISSGRTGTINGHYIQRQLGDFHIDVTNTSTYGQLSVSGSATLLNGAHISVTAVSCSLLPVGSTLASVISAGSVSKGVVTVSDNCAGVDLMAVRNGNAVDLVSIAPSITGIPALNRWGLLTLSLMLCAASLLWLRCFARKGGAFPSPPTGSPGRSGRRT